MLSPACSHTPFTTLKTLSTCCESPLASLPPLVPQGSSGPPPPSPPPLVGSVRASSTTTIILIFLIVSSRAAPILRTAVSMWCVNVHLLTTCTSVLGPDNSIHYTVQCTQWNAQWTMTIAHQTSSVFRRLALGRGEA